MMRVALAALLALVARPVAAQRFSAEASVASAEHRVDVGAGPEVSSGLVFGAGASAALGARWSARVEARAGRFNAAGAGPDRDVGELRVAAGFQALPWLRAEAGFGTRMYSAPIAQQRWTAGSLAAEAWLPFGGNRLAGVGRVEWMPMLTVTDLAAPAAVGAAAGVEYRGPHARLALIYGLERYDFPATGGFARREQLASLALRLSFSPARR